MYKYSIHNVILITAHTDEVNNIDKKGYLFSYIYDKNSVTTMQTNTIQ